jgi:hypothetical protein
VFDNEAMKELGAALLDVEEDMPPLTKDMLSLDLVRLLEAKLESKWERFQKV